jgi:OmpA-OmpF porin, OOP family
LKDRLTAARADAATPRPTPVVEPAPSANKPATRGPEHASAAPNGAAFSTLTKDIPMTKWNTRAAAALLCLCGSVGAAHAQGWYAGGSIGGADWRHDIAGADGDNHGVAGKLYGGYAFLPYFALEAGWQRLGEYGSGSRSIRSHNGFFVDAVGTWPVATDWSLIGRVGAGHARFKAEGDSSSGHGLRAGVGVQYDISKAIALRVEYEHNHFGKVFGSRANIGAYNAGVKFSF